MWIRIVVAITFSGRGIITWDIHNLTDFGADVLKYEEILKVN